MLWRAGVLVPVAAVAGFLLGALLVSVGADAYRPTAVQRILIEPNGIRNAHRVLNVRPIVQQAGLLNDVLSAPETRAGIAVAAGERADTKWSVEVSGTVKTANAAMLVTAADDQLALTLARASARRGVALFQAGGGGAGGFALQPLGPPAIGSKRPGLGLLPWILGIVAALVAKGIMSSRGRRLRPEAARLVPPHQSRAHQWT